MQHPATQFPGVCTSLKVQNIAGMIARWLGFYLFPFLKLDYLKVFARSSAIVVGINTDVGQNR